MGRMPDLEILVRCTESVQAFLLPVAVADLISSPHTRAIVNAIDHLALRRRPFRRHHHMPQNAVRNRADHPFSFQVVEHPRMSTGNAYAVFAAVDVLHGGAVTDHVAQFGGKRSRELVVTSFNLFEGRGIETKHISKIVKGSEVLE